MRPLPSLTAVYKFMSGSMIWYFNYTGFCDLMSTEYAHLHNAVPDICTTPLSFLSRYVLPVSAYARPTFQDAFFGFYCLLGRVENGVWRQRDFRVQCPGCCPVPVDLCPRLEFLSM